MPSPPGLIVPAPPRVVTASSAGPFRLLAHLAEGRRSDAYLARLEGEDRPVVARVLHEGIDRAPFERDARRSEALGSGTTAASIVCAEPCVAKSRPIVGETLATIIDYCVREGRALDVEIAVAIAMAAAGRLGTLIHGDLAPHHVLVGFDGSVHLIDLAGPEDGARRSKAAGRAGHRSPEHVSAEPIDARSDVFVLGVLLYELSTGVRMFGHAKHAENDAAICEARYERPRALVGERYPIEMQVILRKMVHVDPGARFPTCVAAAEGLRLVVARKGRALSERVSAFMHHAFAERYAAWRGAMARAGQVLPAADARGEDGATDLAERVGPPPLPRRGTTRLDDEPTGVIPLDTEVPPSSSQELLPADLGGTFVPPPAKIHPTQHSRRAPRTSPPAPRELTLVDHDGPAGLAQREHTVPSGPGAIPSERTDPSGPLPMPRFEATQKVEIELPEPSRSEVTLKKDGELLSALREVGAGFETPDHADSPFSKALLGEALARAATGDADGPTPWPDLEAPPPRFDLAADLLDECGMTERALAPAPSEPPGPPKPGDASPEPIALTELDTGGELLTLDESLDGLGLDVPAPRKIQARGESLAPPRRSSSVLPDFLREPVLHSIDEPPEGIERELSEYASALPEPVERPINPLPRSDTTRESVPVRPDAPPARDEITPLRSEPPPRPEPPPAPPVETTPPPATSSEQATEQTRAHRAPESTVVIRERRPRSTSAARPPIDETEGLVKPVSDTELRRDRRAHAARTAVSFFGAVAVVLGLGAGAWWLAARSPPAAPEIADASVHPDATPPPDASTATSAPDAGSLELVAPLPEGEAPALEIDASAALEPDAAPAPDATPAPDAAPAPDAEAPDLGPPDAGTFADAEAPDLGPPDTGAFADATARPGAERTTWVRVRAFPSKAQVRARGRLVPNGESIEIGPAPVEVRITAKGYVEQVLWLQPGQQEPVDVILSRKKKR